MRDKVWCISQERSNGQTLYYTGKGHPMSVDAWTPAISRAQRMDWDGAGMMMDYVGAHTGGPAKRVKANNRISS